MVGVLALTFGSGGDSDAGPGGGVIVLAILLLLVGIPAALGFALRIRDSRRGDDEEHEEPEIGSPPASPAFGWGNVPGIRGRTSTRFDWMVVGALALLVLVLLVVTQL
ncbi:hypothetical protein [Patulibacter minatonensis]|uniref:hypothetical protein n=1 Tax=Patulibacter minatonensis TaxID=298163 RepID=UPI00047E3EB4|nr:hypothetical protein [Patulibacter minatonensis]